MLSRLLLDPIAIKELSGTARRWQTYAGRGLYAVMIALLLLYLFGRFDRISGRSE